MLRPSRIIGDDRRRRGSGGNRRNRTLACCAVKIQDLDIWNLRRDASCCRSCTLEGKERALPDRPGAGNGMWKITKGKQLDISFISAFVVCGVFLCFYRRKNFLLICGLDPESEGNVRETSVSSLFRLSGNLVQEFFC